MEKDETPKKLPASSALVVPSPEQDACHDEEQQGEKDAERALMNHQSEEDAEMEEKIFQGFLKDVSEAASKGTKRREEAPAEGAAEMPPPKLPRKRSRKPAEALPETPQGTDKVLLYGRDQQHGLDSSWNFWLNVGGDQLELGCTANSDAKVIPRYTWITMMLGSWDDTEDSDGWDWGPTKKMLVIEQKSSKVVELQECLANCTKIEGRGELDAGWFRRKAVLKWKAKESWAKKALELANMHMCTEEKPWLRMLFMVAPIEEKSEDGTQCMVLKVTGAILQTTKVLKMGKKKDKILWSSSSLGEAQGKEDSFCTSSTLLQWSKSKDVPKIFKTFHGVSWSRPYWR